MNKENTSFLIIFIALFVGALYYNNIIQAPIASALTTVKTSYNSTISFIKDSIDEHFEQRQKIIQLKQQLAQYKELHLTSHSIATELNDLYKASHSKLKSSPKVSLIRTISYVKFGDTNKIWVDMEDFNSSKVYGFVYNEHPAGIIISKNNKPLALLNSDYKSSYAVFVGKNKAPGIIHGNNDKYMIVDFIPTSVVIKPGDEVITSGLDKLFFKGLIVGKVISISRAQGYQSAVVEPVYKNKNVNYFHVINKVN